MTVLFTRRTFLLGSAACLIAGSARGAAALRGTGVVLLHGKTGSPDRHIPGLASALERDDALVDRPEMPWSRRRYLDASLDQAMDEIGQHVAKLRQKGAKRVVVAGHSLGANIALAYGARRHDVDAVAMVGPGHTPDLPKFREALGDSIDRARAMIAAGKGAETGRFNDTNQGRTEEVTARASDYFSFFDPQGLANMPRMAQELGARVPLLVVVGTKDPLFPRGEGYIFGRGARHPLSRYVTVDADHGTTPDAAKEVVTGWLAGLPGA
jgi:pimeloyl-ACP methyl ester carboxylesterase